MVSLGVTTAFISVLCWAAYTLLAKKAAPTLGNKKLALILTGAGVIPMAIILLVLGFQWPGTVPFLLAIGGGLAIAVANFLTFKSMETEQITNVAALGEIASVAITLYGVFVLHNPLTSIEAASIVLIFVCVFLVMSNEKININKKLIPALAGGVLWGAYWILLTISITSSNTFQLQILTSRIVGVSLLAAFIYFTGIKVGKESRVGKRAIYTTALLIALLAGLADGAGDGLFGVTMHLNVVAEGGAVSALAPIIVSIIAYFIYKDRLTNMQMVGLIGIVIGSIVLALF